MFDFSTRGAFHVALQLGLGHVCNLLMVPIYTLTCEPYEAQAKPPNQEFLLWALANTWDK